MQEKKLSYQDVTAQLIHGDALAFLDSLRPNSVDLVITSPPYCMGKEYDNSVSVDDFMREHARILKAVITTVKDGGSICWQVGYHVEQNQVVPLDALIYEAARAYPTLKLRNRIVWTFGHGAHALRRFSGRHETILWFTKGNDYIFNLDEVRIPQKYPGKRHYKGPRKGQWSGNPLGKNPADLWDIPNVKAHHVEKTNHPCQFPVALARRLVRALSCAGGLIVDPYMGAGTAAVAALTEGRNFAGSDIEKRYVAIARSRIQLLIENNLPIRDDVPTLKPIASESVSRPPPHFRVNTMADSKHGK